jgi:hypothetical protein
MASWKYSIFTAIQVLTGFMRGHETDDPDNPKRHVTVLHLPPVVSP